MTALFKKITQDAEKSGPRMLVVTSHVSPQIVAHGDTAPKGMRHHYPSTGVGGEPQGREGVNANGSARKRLFGNNPTVC